MRNQKAVSKPKDAKKTILNIVKYMGVYKYLFILAVLLAVAQTLANAGIPYVFSNMVKNQLNDSSAMKVASLEILGLGAIYGIFMLSKNVIITRVTQRVIRNIRVDAFNSLIETDVSYFDNNASGGIVSRLTNDIDTMSNAVGDGFIQAVTSLFSIIFSFVFLLVVVPFNIAIIIIIAIPLLFFVIGKLAKNMFKYFSSQQKQMAEVNSLVEESIYGINIVKLYNQEQNIVDEFKKKNKKLREANFKAGFYSSLMGPLITIFQNMIYVAIVIIGIFIYLDVKGANSPENIRYAAAIITAATAYLAQLIGPVRQIGQLFGNLSSGIAGGERVFTLINLKSEHNLENKVELKKIEGHIEFKDVDFSYYEGKKILKNLNFDIKPGETIAIVGPTGSGKTTIINLLSKFYDIDSGDILIDGVSIKKLDKKQLRKRVGVVLQDNYLFKGSVEDNIRYGKFDATKEEIIESAKKANANGFISRLPHGYESLIQSGGSNLSLGERQLISIARTLISDPDLLILDEATSSVDTRTESSIITAMEKLSEGRTSFVIAHRLQTVRNADRIMVIKDGEIIELDTHDALIANKGLYYNLYTSQFKDN